MRFGSIFRTLGILLTLFSLAMFPPLLVSSYYQDGASKAFFIGFALSLSTGLILWLSTYRYKKTLKVREGLVLTSLFWSVLSFFGAIPIALADPELTFIDALFESVSGFTTTGATVIDHLDYLPKSLLFFRNQLQWMGGMGIVVLAVAILPTLGIGGVHLYRAETPGPSKANNTLTSVAETAKMLWYIYVALTVLCMLAYLVAGMSLFDAVTHSFSTIAIGGFSTYNESIGAFDSPMIESIAIFFMFIAGINFVLHFTAWKKRTLKQYFQDVEFRFYLFVLILLIIISVFTLFMVGNMNTTEALRKGIFQSVSLFTTTGFTTDSFAQWPLFLPVLLVLSSFIGGCTGSTAGGMKVLRILLLLKQGYREIKRTLHPDAVFNIRIAGQPVYNRTIETIWGFFSVYVFVFIGIMLILMASGIDSETAWVATTATLNNLGPGLGTVADHYGDINSFAKLTLCLAMLLGRLEIFTLLVIFTPIMWRQ